MRKVVLLFIATGFSLAGLVAVGDPIPEFGEAGAPHRALSPAEEARFRRGRLAFDRDFSVSDGVGEQFNGDSCRACHRDPVIGGSGGIDVQVQRPAVNDGSGNYFSPPETGPLVQTHCVPGAIPEEVPLAVEFVEERNSPSILGLGLVQAISDAAILANEDPDDLITPDGIRGVAHRLDGGVIGKLGWKAQVPDLRSFVRDAMGNELGITVPVDPNNDFGFEADEDGVADPELSSNDFEDIVFFLELLDFAPKGPENAETQAGRQIFDQVGCNKCHVPVLDGVELYSDLLLHDIQPDGFVGVTQGAATSGLYRTAPLRGLSDTAPYFHDGRAETVDDAIRRHDGTAKDIRTAYENLTDSERAALLAFLGTR